MEMLSRQGSPLELISWGCDGDAGRGFGDGPAAPAWRRFATHCWRAGVQAEYGGFVSRRSTTHELVEPEVRDFNAETGTLSVVDGKTAARDIVLTKKAIRFFHEISVGRPSDDLLLPRDDGTSWGKNHHVRPMQDAVKRAKLSEAARCIRCVIATRCKRSSMA
jgi:hypothetical protein